VDDFGKLFAVERGALADLSLLVAGDPSDSVILGLDPRIHAKAKMLEE
jgi:hypothetical protein